MDPLNVLDDLRIASPCTVPWTSMPGDDRVRYCASCSRNVYNLSNLTRAEAAALIEGAEGRPCMRLYRRRDGTLLTADCPAGLRVALRRPILKVATVCVLMVAGIQSAVWLTTRGEPRRELPPMPTGPGVTLVDWSDWAAIALGIRKVPPSPSCCHGY